MLLIQLDTMDQFFNIYANIERPSDNPSTRKRELQSSENIYENYFIHPLEANRTGPALSGNKYMQTSLDVHSSFYKQVLQVQLAFRKNGLCEKQ